MEVIALAVDHIIITVMGGNCILTIRVQWNAPLFRLKWILVGMLLIVCIKISATEGNELQSIPDKGNIICIPVNFTQNKIYITAKLNDSIETNFLLDTGAGYVSLDLDFVNKNKVKLGLLVLPTKMIHTTLDGKYSSYRLAIHSVKPREKPTCLKANVNGRTYYLKKPLALKGLNLNLFPVRALSENNKIINFDLPNNKIYLIDSIKRPFDTLNFTLNKYCFGPTISTSIEVYCNGKSTILKGKFLIDYGSPYLCTITNDFSKQYSNLEFEELKYLGNTKIRTNICLIDSAIINKVKFKRSVLWTSPLIPPGIDGIIGVEMLKHLNVALDYKKEIFYYHANDTIVENKTSPNLAFRKWGIDANLISTRDGKNKVIITLLRKSKESFHKDVELGDALRSVTVGDVIYIKPKDIESMYTKADEIEIVKNNGQTILLK